MEVASYDAVATARSLTVVQARVGVVLVAVVTGFALAQLTVAAAWELAGAQAAVGLVLVPVVTGFVSELAQRAVGARDAVAAARRLAAG